jgi:hypothetical protein
MPLPLISTRAVTPLDWIKTHPKSVPSSFLGASIPPQELTMDTAGSPDIFQAKCWS